MAQARQAFAQCLVGNGECDAHVAVAARPKGYSRYHCCIARDKEVAREIERAAAGPRDIDERIERTLRDERQHSGIAEHVCNEIAAAPKGIAEKPCALLIARKRGLPRFL